MTQILKTIAEWKMLRNSEQYKNKTVGFVPTMGALHAGHQSLLQQCRQENDIAVLSIFVNPTQFNNPNDLQYYPKTLDTDLQMAQAEKMDYLFLPAAPEIYADDYRYKVMENSLSQRLCGAYRPGHFDGVLTVVLKLLNLVRPQKIYLGKKDYQQYLLIKEMITALFMDCEVVGCATVRDSSGLALSSRNQRLTLEEKKMAAEFPRLLQTKDSTAQVKKQLESLGFVVDYVEDFNGRRLAAVHIGNVRLIDNVEK